MIIDITTEDSDLVRNVYRFYVSDRHGAHLFVRLNAYMVQRRESRRHKWRDAEVWPARRGYGASRTAKCPNISQEIKDAVICKVTESIVFEEESR